MTEARGTRKDPIIITDPKQLKRSKTYLIKPSKKEASDGRTVPVERSADRTRS